MSDLRDLTYLLKQPDIAAPTTSRSLIRLEALVGLIERVLALVHGDGDVLFVGWVRAELLQERVVVDRGLVEELADAFEMLGRYVCDLHGLIGLCLRLVVYLGTSEIKVVLALSHATIKENFLRLHGWSLGLGR